MCSNNIFLYLLGVNLGWKRMRDRERRKETEREWERERGREGQGGLKQIFGLTF
jgi:hypothetical protein